jgi:hypothetical protein
MIKIYFTHSIGSAMVTTKESQFELIKRRIGALFSNVRIIKIEEQSC